FPVIEIIMAIALGLLVWYGSKEVLADRLSPGVIVAFIMYINMIFRPIRELVDKFNTLHMGLVSAERIFAELETDEKTSNEGTKQPSHIHGAITFKNVWFAYHDEKLVLKDINCDVRPGETLALVGAPGAGKSSTINILGRFSEVNRGA